MTTTNTNTVPAHILDAAKREGVQSSTARAWFQAFRLSHGVALDASPADWPPVVWEAYTALRLAADPAASATDATAGALFEKLGING